MRWCPRCGRPIRALSHRYYALKARWFGKKTLPNWDRNAPLPKVAMRTFRWTRGAGDGAVGLWAFSPKMADIAERFFTDRWIDAPVRPGQVAGRVLASDRAVGASLRAAQLPGQAARRDDARP